MKALFEKINRIKKDADVIYNEESIAEYISSIYSNIPYDIIRYFFVKHSNYSDQILLGLNPLDATTFEPEIITLCNDDLLDASIIDNAPFGKKCNDDVLDERIIATCKKNGHRFQKTGTWDAPIITIKQDGKLLVVDGTIRFLNMRIYIKYEFSNIKSSHKVWVLNP